MPTYLRETRVPDLPELEFIVTEMDDPRAAFMLSDLQAEYDRLYPEQAAAAQEEKEINAYPASAFTEAEGGAFVLLLSRGQAVAGGAIMKTHDPLAPRGAAEFKRIWSHAEHRGKGLAKYLLRQLEFTALALGYRTVYLTTGPNQPAAVGLYESFGYDPVQVAGRSEHVFYAFTKPLHEHTISMEGK